MFSTTAIPSTAEPSPIRTIIITGVSPFSPLSLNSAIQAANSHFSEPNSKTLHIALLGPPGSLKYLNTTKIQLLQHTPIPPSDTVDRRLEVQTYEVDITSPESVGIVSHQIRAELGAWDIFLHNAPAHFVTDLDSQGEQILLRHGTTIRGSDEDVWWSHFERNVKSLHHVARHHFSKMRRGAKFVNLLSADVDGVFSERKSAEIASAAAAKQIVRFLEEENKEVHAVRCRCVWIDQRVGSTKESAVVRLVGDANILQEV